MFLKDEKDRLASVSAVEVDRLRQEASDLREELARERKSREKLEVRHRLNFHAAGIAIPECVNNEKKQE
jgi:hypothetical protein